MNYILRDEFNRLKKYNIEELGIKPEIIIENQALKVIKNIDLDRRKTFGILCGLTNNGAIGLAIARNLFALGKQVEIYIIDNKEGVDEDFEYQFSLIKKLNIKINDLETLEELQSLSSDLNRVNTIIDAVTGLEYKFMFNGTTEYIIDTINKARIYTISVDIPSGLDSDDENSNLKCIDSDVVVTFHKLKKGLNKKHRINNIEIFVENIGLFERGKNVRY
ncbi:NAD(P)H-hydrate epimerase [Helcococcus ovis]|uniref:NAD(P)H-hydrate epimerase n=1 Tax=Helcococcus ovis TaxID=72026 RepID=A0A4V3IYD1_9FIRM|nr:NAD(P)H-hydrate epimerase [Helcococcus ovis]TFF64119.1 NAD(P)H-hydrate epimerase [Helcococcus ovis]TFF66770.1 NAD(P)H-hydrate epimerase [Helcococcus ovis]